MAKTHLFGSLSQNITDIIKGGGCPKIKPPNKRYSVLRYFSRTKNDTYPSIGGVVGDGGYFNDSGDNPFQSGNHQPNFFYTPININLNDNIPHVAGTFPSGTYVGDNNFLNICNRRELISGADDDYINDDNITPSIQNIELANDVIEKDIDGYYNYNLYKKNHTMDIIPAGSSTPVSKTAELMEFVYLHAFVAKCRAGELYIEIEDFDLTGETTNDYLIYCYYWETTRDKSSIASAFRNVNDFLSSNDDLLLTDQSNTVCKVFKLSDVKGTGVDKKLIIWLNKNKTRQESFAVNVLIGLCPQELRRDEQASCPNSTDTYPVISYDECDDIVFKFKKATIKNRKFATTINNQPMACPDFGFKNLTDDAYSNDSDNVTIIIHSLNASGAAVGNYVAWGDTPVSHGIPNTGIVSGLDTWRNAVFYSGWTFSEQQPYMRYTGSVIDSFCIYKFFRTNDQLDDAQNYILKLPNITNPMIYKIAINGASYSINVPPPTNFYYDVIAAPSSDYVIRVYAGDDLYYNTGDNLPRWKDLIDSLVLIQTFALTDLTEGAVVCNSGEDYESYDVMTGVDPVIGTPFYGDEETRTKKNKYKYLSFSGSLLSGLVSPFCFYISIEKTGEPIKSISYGASLQSGLYFPTGYTPPATNDSPAFMEVANFTVIQDYIRPVAEGGADSAVYKNYGCMLFKAPQIIPKSDTPTAENYFA